MLRKFLTGFFFLLVCMAAFTWYCNRWVERASADLVFDEASQLPLHKAGLLLGTGKYLGDRQTINPYFKKRIDAAALLYQLGKIKAIIISGDNSKPDYNEPQDMRLALLELGVPDSVIYLDFAGFRTNDSVIRCKDIFGQDEMTIISQRFHNERAVMIAGEYGIKAHGFNAEEVGGKAAQKTNLREYMARVKLFIDLKITHRQPKYLGSPVQIK